MAGGSTTSYFALTKGATALTVYGAVPQAQDVGVGSYSDSIVANINY